MNTVKVCQFQFKPYLNFIPSCLKSNMKYTFDIENQNKKLRVKPTKVNKINVAVETFRQG